MAHPLERERHEIGPPPTANVRLEIKDAIFADMTAADLLPQLLRLPKKERAALAHELLKSLHDEPEDLASPEEIEAAWDAEIQRRSEELDNGTVKAIPWSEHMALMEQRKAARRAKPDR